MTPEQYQRVRELFDAACQLEAARRTEYLDSACDGDLGVREEVDKLLAADAETVAGFGTPSPDMVHRRIELAAVPDHIGPYRIIARLGAGGMGTVYEAEQSSPRRTVALKVITPGYEADAVSRRFQRESELLGRLQHNGIAQIYEAGFFDSAGGGPPRPFFAMELVQGEPLTAYADHHRLGTRDRLALIRVVCAAVQHAHDRGIVHRDLKPSNILVTQGGEPKVLDFGIARPLDTGVADVTLHTRTGQIVGTVAYMSPEQASGMPDRVDHRADVYALGVIAYELLTGKPPFDLGNTMLHEAVRRIREEDPPSLASTNRTLAGDVDTIVRKTLAKEPERRYQSAAELADDIGRYLAEQPISARPPSTWYQLAMFSRRNRALVTSVAIIFAVLIVALAVTATALRRSIAAQRTAAEERTQADAIVEILTSSLSSANPNIEGDANYTVAQLLDDLRGTLADRGDLRPETEARVRQVLADTYVGLGRYDDAVRELERTVALWLEVQGPDGLKTLDARTDLAAAILDTGDYERAGDELQEITERSERLLGSTHEDTLVRKHYLASAMYRLGKLKDAEQMFAEITEIRSARDGDANEDTLSALASLALVLQRSGEPQAALRYSERAVSGYTELLGPEHPFTLTARSNRALLRSQLDELAAAEREFRDILAIRLRTFPPDHSDVGISLLLLGRTLKKLEQFAEAEEKLLASYEQLNRVLGGEHAYTTSAAESLVELYDQTGRGDEAQIWRTRVEAEKS